MSISRFERAALLAERLPGVATDNAPFVRLQVAELHRELVALGFDLRALHGPTSAWSIPRPVQALDQSDWGRPDARTWMYKRLTAVDAFWTDPSSPSLRLAQVDDPSGRPRVAPPAVERVDLFEHWTPPAPQDDFLTSSPDSVLPANARIALNPSLGLDFSYAPHPTLPAASSSSVAPVALPPHVTTLESLARLGLSNNASVPSVGPSTTLRVAPLTPSVNTALAVPRTASVWEPALAAPRWTVSGEHEATSLFQGPSLHEPVDGLSRSFLTGQDVLGAGSAWTHQSAGFAYPVTVGNGFDMSVKFDEWTFGERSASGLSSSRSFGLDRARLQDAGVNFNYNFDSTLSLHGGYVYTRTTGLSAPAFDTGALNVTEDRAYPYLGFDYKISRNARWNVNIRLYNTPLDFSTTASGPRSTINLTDPQVTTEVHVRF